MKKHIIITSIFLSMLLLCSCTESNFIEPKESTEKPTEESSSTDIESNNLTESASEFVESNISIEKSTKYDDVINDNDLKDIYHVFSLSAPSSPYNYTNVIVDAEHFQRPGATLKKTIMINGVEHKLTYVDSLYHISKGKILDGYFMDADEDAKVYLYGDQILYLSYDQMKLDITSSATPEEILALLQNETSELFDISKYKYIVMPQKTDKVNFGSYTFDFYNAINGVVTNTLTLRIKDDGRISSIIIDGVDFEFSNLNVNINEDLEQQAIELKLKDTYGELYYSYELYDSLWNKCLTIYKDELYIKYLLEPEIYYGDGDGTTRRGVEEIIIPLDMIRDN